MDYHSSQLAFLFAVFSMLTRATGLWLGAMAAYKEVLFLPVICRANDLNTYLMNSY